MLSFPGLTGAEGGGANVIRGDECTISLAELGVDWSVTTTDTQSVETPSGNLSLVCRADLPDGLDPPPRAVRTTGQRCETPLGPTTDTEKVITPAGKVRLTCLINGKPPPRATGWVAGENVGGYGVIIHTTDGGQTWVRQGQVGEIPDVSLGGVAAIDAQNAWVVGKQGTILRTYDGGCTWQLQEVPDEVSDAELIAVSAVDGNTAWAVGGTGEQSALLHTTDGGQTWTRQGQGMVPDVVYQGVYASDAEHAWAVGPEAEPGNEYGTIVRTTDGGITWETIPYTVSTRDDYYLITVHGHGASTLWAVGHDQALYSTDGGLTWVDGGLRVGLFDENGVYVVDDNTVWVVTDNGGIYRSDDAGANWETQATPAGGHIVRISALDAHSAWAVTGGDWTDKSGHVLQTADGGQTWIAQTTPVAPEFWGVSFVK